MHTRIEFFRRGNFKYLPRYTSTSTNSARQKKARQKENKASKRAAKASARDSCVFSKLKFLAMRSILLLPPLTLRGVAAQTDLTRHRHPQWRRHRHRGFGKEVIVDMGFNIGQDTAAYLELGYDVVAVEANPRLSAWANQSEPFKSALATAVQAD